MNMKWTDIWHKPFKYDHYGYIWDVDNVMVFTVEDLTEANDREMAELCGDIVAVLNGEDHQRQWDLQVKDGCDIYRGEEFLGSFRGWGFLRGVLKLTPEDAAATQDQLIAFVLDKLAK